MNVVLSLMIDDDGSQSLRLFDGSYYNDDTMSISSSLNNDDDRRSVQFFGSYCRDKNENENRLLSLPYHHD